MGNVLEHKEDKLLTKKMQHFKEKVVLSSFIVPCFYISHGSGKKPLYNVSVKCYVTEKVSGVCILHPVCTLSVCIAKHIILTGQRQK